MTGGTVPTSLPHELNNGLIMGITLHYKALLNEEIVDLYWTTKEKKAPQDINKVKPHEFKG